MSTSLKMKLWGMAIAALCAPTVASAATYTYDLDGTYNSSTGGPALSPDGGTLGATGYSFGPNQGLTLGPVGGSAFTSYSIAVGFYFTDAATARGNGYRKIVDFSNLVDDAGLYTHTGAVSLFPHGDAGSVAFGQEATVTIARSAAGFVTVGLNGNQILSYDDSTTNQYVFTNLNALHFFEDDAHTAQGEAGTGFVDSIVVNTDAAMSPVPLPASAPMFGAALVALGAAGYGLKRRKASAAA